MVESNVHWVLKSCNALQHPKVNTNGSAVHSLMTFAVSVCSCQWVQDCVGMHLCVQIYFWGPVCATVKKARVRAGGWP